jgi:hypothetical protein
MGLSAALAAQYFHQLLQILKAARLFSEAVNLTNELRRIHGGSAPGPGPIVGGPAGLATGPRAGRVHKPRRDSDSPLLQQRDDVGNGRFRVLGEHLADCGASDEAPTAFSLTRSATACGERAKATH